MRIFLILILVLLLTSCQQQVIKSKSLIVSGHTSDDAEYLILGNDTIEIKNGIFQDTFEIEEDYYQNVKLSTWKWGKLIYLNQNKNLNIDLIEDGIKVVDDPLNTFLLNSDSILKPYSLRWDMEEDTFRNTIASELEVNFKIIDDAFANVDLSNDVLNELKSIEKLKVAHRTANFISFQERKGISIDRSIYDFLAEVDLNNKRLEHQINNRNFQYYYLLDKVDEELPDSIYPFAVIDTINKYSKIESIQKMIISSAIKSSFYNEEVAHQKLLSIYENDFGKLNKGDELLLLYEKTKKLKPGSNAPSFGKLESESGEMVGIDDLKGKNILLTVWGTWCPYCQEELPALKSLIDKYGDKFTSIGISFDKDKEKWKAYIEESEWDAIHLIDPERSSTFKSNYLVSGTNVHLLIDKEGVILSNKGVKPSTEELENLIKMLR